MSLTRPQCSMLCCHFQFNSVSPVVTHKNTHQPTTLIASSLERAMKLFATLLLNKREPTILENYNNNFCTTAKCSDKEESLQQITDKLWFRVHFIFYHIIQWQAFVPSFFARDVAVSVFFCSLPIHTWIWNVGVFLWN